MISSISRSGTRPVIFGDPASRIAAFFPDFFRLGRYLGDGVTVRLHYLPSRPRVSALLSATRPGRPVSAPTRLHPPRGPDHVVAARPRPDPPARPRHGPGRRPPGRREALRPGAAHPLERLARRRLARPAAPLQGRAGLPQADDQATPDPDPRAGDRPPVHPPAPRTTGPGRAACSPSGTTRTRPRPRPCSTSTASPSAWPSTPTTNATATSTSA